MLFELLPYPMDIVITFLKPSKFYITSKRRRLVEESTTCHEHIWQSGRSEVAAVYGNYTIEVQKKITRPGAPNQNPGHAGAEQPYHVSSLDQ